jgi:hypothetical protein
MVPGMAIPKLVLAMFVWTGLCWAGSGVALAEESAATQETDVQALERKNRDLERRLQQLEQKQRDSEVEHYLDGSADSESAQGEDKLTPKSQRLRFSGQLRVRGEVHDHLYSDQPDGEDSFYLTRMRTRVRMDFDVVENILVVVELQDTRLFGEGGSTSSTLDNTDLRRAFMDFKDVFGSETDLRVGRMVLKYGQERMIGALEWVDQGRTYDGARAQYRPEKWWLDGFAVTVRETGAVNDDQHLFGVYGGVDWIEGYALVVNDRLNAAGETGGGTTLFVTLGVRLHGKARGFHYSFEVPIQLGEFNGDDLNAWAFVLNGGYIFEDAGLRPNIHAELAFASGDNNPTDGKQRGFRHLYPTNHGPYGRADQVGLSNIIDIMVGVELTLSDKWRMNFDYHHFRRPTDTGEWIGATGAVIRTGAAGSGKHLADEIDIMFTWLHSDAFKVDMGWAIFLPGTFIEDTGQSPTAHFLYLSGMVIF